MGSKMGGSRMWWEKKCAEKEREKKKENDVKRIDGECSEAMQLPNTSLRGTDSP